MSSRTPRCSSVLDGNATVVVQQPAASEADAERRERELLFACTRRCAPQGSSREPSERPPAPRAWVQSPTPPGASPGACRTAQAVRDPRDRPVVLAAGIGAATVGGAAAVGSNCDLSSLRPVSIGENSFVYAADDSLLGTIPAERNRQPVSLKEMSPWLSKGDDRDRGPPLLRARRRRLRGHRPRADEGHPRRPDRRGRLDDHAAARAQPLPGLERADDRAQDQGGLPRDQAQPAVVE